MSVIETDKKGKTGQEEPDGSAGAGEKWLSDDEPSGELTEKSRQEEGSCEPHRSGNRSAEPDTNIDSNQKRCSKRIATAFGPLRDRI